MLARMLQHISISLPAPKSTGRDLFNEAWLNSQLRGVGVVSHAHAPAVPHPSEQEEQRMLQALTARSIALHLKLASFSVSQVRSHPLPLPLPSPSASAFLDRTSPLLQRGPHPHLLFRLSCTGGACATRRSCASFRVSVLAQSCPAPPHLLHIQLPSADSFPSVRLKALASTLRRWRSWRSLGSPTPTARQRRCIAAPSSAAFVLF